MTVKIVVMFLFIIEAITAIVVIHLVHKKMARIEKRQSSSV